MPSEADRTAQVFRALADPTRRRLLDRLCADNGQTLGALCRDLALTRQGITQHLAVLELAGLVSTIRRGRERLHYLDPLPLHDIYAGWIAKFVTDNHLIDRSRLVHVTYIATTPDQLWNALTDPEATGRFWRHRNVSGWIPGDCWEHRRLDDNRLELVGTILESDPPRRLAHTWVSAADANASNASDPERPSRVIFDLEPVGEAVRLTLTHDDVPGDEVEGTNRRWTIVLASLKSMLETGRPLRSLL